MPPASGIGRQRGSSLTIYRAKLPPACDEIREPESAGAETLFRRHPG
jgi:hypothetical protein